MADEKLRYEPVIERTREEIEEILRANHPEQVCEALWSAVYYDPDWRWVQQQCLNYMLHPDLSLRCCAVMLLGVLAVFHKRLDVDLVVPALHQAAQEPALRPWAEDSLDDIRHNIKFQ